MDAEQARALELLQRAQAQITDLVDAVEREQWDAAVLPGLDVADLVAHLVAEQRRVPRLLGGPAGGRLPTDTEELIAGDPLGSWEDAADAALTAWAQALVTGPAPGTDDLARLTADLAVHAWDLARATGGDTRLDAELVAAAAAAADRRLLGGGFPCRVGPPVEVPVDADPLVRLLAASGRRT